MSLLAGLTTDESIKESKDSVGGGFTAKPSGIVTGKQIGRAHV